MEKKELNEVVGINGSKVYIEDGEVKTQLSEAIQNGGYMTVEEAQRLTLAKIRKIYEKHGKL